MNQDKVISVISKSGVHVISYRDKRVGVLVGDETNEQIASLFEDVLDECVKRKNKAIDDMVPVLQDLVYKVYLQGVRDGNIKAPVARKSMFDSLFDFML